MTTRSTPSTTRAKETVEETEFEGKNCYKVKLVEHRPTSETFEFFDKESGPARRHDVGKQAENADDGRRSTSTSIIERMDRVVRKASRFPGKTIVQRMMGMDRIISDRSRSMDVNKVDPKPSSPSRTKSRRSRKAEKQARIQADE